MDDERNQKLLKLLDIVSQRVRHQHSALWEEEKHYSWWVYVLFAGLIWVYTNEHLSVVQKHTIITLGGIFGMGLAFWAFQGIRRESEYFLKADRLMPEQLARLT